MALDFRRGVYRPNRPDTRLKTTYGVMSEWQRYGKRRQSRPVRPVDPDAIGLHPWSVSSDTHSDAAAAALDDTIPIHARYASGYGYDAFHNAYLAIKRHGPPDDFPVFGPPRLRQGRAGGSWRHIKEVMQAGGRRIVFVDGQISTNDTLLIDEVPGGNLILPSHAGPKRKAPTTSGKLLQHSGSMAGRRAVTVQKGLEKDNWAIIR